MNKSILYLLIVVFLLGGIGYGVYYVGTNIASKKITDDLQAELHNSGQLDEVRAYIENDPALQRYLEEVRQADRDTLPFNTKEEATRVLIRKVGITDLLEMQSRVERGQMSQQEIINELESSLTEDELLALKVIAYKELYE
ncbi:hypothetical protein M3689_12070 [Alkalihalophilus marmarensis]|uniref:Phenylalanyl-tRNA synthetase subunit beta n=1 Tax=Alkalihalophilus marmarensis DSM 21297 TaxID=1188261 RepID=U6SRN8_9BACI|nr:hypothetical protein [Alkalihalophilus marmarensis]ERN53575.1 hypothetical protein A33I_11115 [Alkalihalophilus marmarensis DSM 21297]MCM3490047.1 hypothetical protein [Alkalihalophilus marmarensis]